MHVKHVSNVTFYHLSNRYLSNVMKISAKINTMQNNNILLFIQLDCGDINSIVIAMVRVAPFFDSRCSAQMKKKLALTRY